MFNLKDFCVNSTITILDALKTLDINGQGILFILENHVLFGSLTDGDVRRALINGATKQDCVKQFCNEKITYRHFRTPAKEVMELFDEDIKVIPLVDDYKRVVDIATQVRPHNVILMEPRLNGKEYEYVADCLNTNWISSQGSYVSRFEKQITGVVDVDHCLAVSNGTVALHLALETLGIGNGHEVITTNLTFGATVNSIIHAGATPVLVDVDKDTWNIDVALIEAAITPNTKAIIPVHLYGNPCDMMEIMALAKKYNLYVIEDCAESLGAAIDQRPVGSFGDISTVSFFANKVVTTGEGGSLQTNNEKVYLKAKQLRDHGMRPDRRYWHDIVGYNYRLTNIQAAIGCAQLEQLNEFAERRVKLFDIYKDLFSDCEYVKEQYVRPGHVSANWLFTICLQENFANKRDELMEYLKLKGIETRPIFYPMSDMPAFEKLIESQEYPVSNSISYSGISLPSSLNMSVDECRYVVQNILRFFGQNLS